MRSFAYALLLGGMVAHPVGAGELSQAQRDVKQAGSVLRFALPAAALLATTMLEARPREAGETSFWLMGGTPRHDLLLALLRSEAVTRGLKLSIDEQRPDGGKHSFPSGHTSMAFAGAEFLRKEYGWQWGSPALLAAAFVGWSRVESKRHYTHDVIAGAAIGLLANHDFWRRSTAVGELAIAPSMLSDLRGSAPGLGFQLAIGRSGGL